jgi:hypothetical protein
LFWFRCDTCAALYLVLSETLVGVFLDADLKRSSLESLSF